MLEGMGSSEFYRTLFPGDCKRKLRLPDRFAKELGDRRHAKLRLAGGGEQRLWDVKVVDDEDRYLGPRLDGVRRRPRPAGRPPARLPLRRLRRDHRHRLRRDHVPPPPPTRLLVRRRFTARPMSSLHRRRRAAEAPAPTTTAPAAGGVGRSVTGSGSGSSAGASGGGSPAVAADAEQSQFAVTLRPSNLRSKKNQYLHVPVPFQDAHGYAERRRVTLRMGGRSWTVNLKHSKRTRGNRTALKYGWHQFCLDNGLRVGDICIFKVLREGDGGDDDDHYDDDDGEDHVLKVEVRKKDGTFLD